MNIWKDVSFVSVLLMSDITPVSPTLTRFSKISMKLLLDVGKYSCLHTCVNICNQGNKYSKWNIQIRKKSQSLQFSVKLSFMNHFLQFLLIYLYAVYNQHLHVKWKLCTNLIDKGVLLLNLKLWSITPSLIKKNGCLELPPGGLQTKEGGREGFFF